MFKCIIVDDEPLAIEVIESYLNRIGNFEISGKCNNALQALELVNKFRIDLIFLDIQMPKITGLEFIKTLKNPPEIIITTAYRDYAIEGFELDVLDYLLKPISFERFLKAVNKVNGNREHSPSNASIHLKSDKKMVKILLDDIIYIESLKDYVRVKCINKEVISHQKISHLDQKLPSQMFLRIHRSFIAAINKIEAYSAAELELPNKTIPIGRNYKADVIKLLESRKTIEI